MSIKNNLKHLVFKLPENWIHGIYSLYNYFVFSDFREEKKCFGPNNKNQIFYVIRPRPGKVEGLMALFTDTIKQIDYAKSKGFIPIVDFQNYETQYKDEKLKQSNAWEYYFKQVSAYSLDDVYKSQNVHLAGLNAIENCASELRQKFDSESLKYARKIVNDYIDFSDDVKDFVAKQESQLNLSNALGLYLRGTDYTKFRPAGHPVQPTVEQAIEIVDVMLKKYQLKNVYLVTEDFGIFETVKKHYGDSLLLVSYDSFISGYDGINFLGNDDKSINQLASSPYERGLFYLCKLILLSKCKYFVGGNTSGSWAATVFSDGFVDQYVFDLGKY